MSILALDLGTSTGWAWCDGNTLSPMMSGVWRLKASKSVTHESRFISILAELDMLNEHKRITTIYYEQVRRHLGTDAAHIYGGFVATLTIWCGKTCPLIGVPVGTIKKFWTGQGNATKAMMMDEARNRGFNPQDDNEADAIALLHYAMRPGR